MTSIWSASNPLIDWVATACGDSETARQAVCCLVTGTPLFLRTGDGDREKSAAYAYYLGRTVAQAIGGTYCLHRSDSVEPKTFGMTNVLIAVDIDLRCRATRAALLGYAEERSSSPFLFIASLGPDLRDTLSAVPGKRYISAVIPGRYAKPATVRLGVVTLADVEAMRKPSPEDLRA